MKVRVRNRAPMFATLLLLVAPAMVLAQPPGPPPEGGPPDGPPPREGRAGAARGGAAGGMDGSGPLMAALDTNHDGVLSAEEIRKATEALKALDRDRNGRIDRAELRPRVADRGGRAGQARRGPGGAGGFGPPPGGPGGFGPGGPEGEGFGPPPGGPGGFGPGGPGGRGPEIGDVLPPFVRDAITLDAEQGRRIQALEADVRAKLGTILSREQMRQFEDALRRGPGGPPGGGPPRGPGGPPDDDGPPVRPGRPD